MKLGEGVDLEQSKLKSTKLRCSPQLTPSSFERAQIPSVPFTDCNTAVRQTMLTSESYLHVLGDTPRPRVADIPTKTYCLEQQ
jgi:hypothetical protein